MKQVKKIGIFFAAVLLLVAGLSCFAGCEKKWKWFTEEQHLERVRKRVEERYMGEGSEYTSFEVFPVYNEYDELGYFVVDFQPQGYVYVKLNERASFLRNMYTRDINENQRWYPYTIEEGMSTIVDNGEYVNRKFMEDGEGNYISYCVSHFKAANVGEERRYLLPVEREIDVTIAWDVCYIPAIKQGDVYQNLISRETMDYSPGMKNAVYAMADIQFFIDSLSAL